MLSTAVHWYADHAPVVFAGAVLGAIGVEQLMNWRRRAAARAGLDQNLASVTSAAAFLVVKTIVGKLVFLAVALHVYERYRIWDLDLALPIVWIAAFVVRDFVYYWVHRAEHRVRILWASHLIHHSPEEMTFTHAVRVPWMEALYKPWIGLWVPLIGFHPLAFAILDMAAATYGQLYHTSAGRRRSWLDWLVVTPSTHRVHHGSNTEYIDKNFSAVFIIWDRLFGTYAPEIAPVRFGLVGDKHLDTPAEVLVGGYPDLVAGARAHRDVSSRVRYLLSAP